MKEITIVLDNSLYAHAFNRENQIHKTLLDKALDIITKQLNQIKTACSNEIYLDHTYHTISVFGDRGSGKTSFLISLLNVCKNSRDFNVEVLPIIDPTLVEHKKPIILCIISMINQLVEAKLKRVETSPDGKSFAQQKEWRRVMSDVSTGVFAIDNVGEDYNNVLWQDEDFVLHTGLSKVAKANNFEKILRDMIRTSLEILGKKAFIIAFDDIDVYAKQGWNVLETLRRYLSDDHLISIVSGDLKLYSMLVRHALAENLTISNAKAKERMTNELENQYMIKLLNPANRINLQSLYNLLQLGNSTIKVPCASSDSKYNDGKGFMDLKDAYKEILELFRIKDVSSRNMYVDFFTNMSLRSQIHFLKDAYDDNYKRVSLGVFASRLLASEIDLNVLELNAQIANISILNYLHRNEILKDSYLLLPSLSDKDCNSNLTAFSLLTCNHFSRQPFAIFDYMLRIGYLRNVVYPIEKKDVVEHLCNYAGWTQLLSLKNSVGLTMAYVKGKNLGNMKEYIPMFGLEQIAKKSKKTETDLEKAFDKALKESNDNDAKLLAMFPFIRIIHSRNNESRCFYSIFLLLAVIGELLKCEDKDDIMSSINDLKLLRSYQMPQNEGSSVDESEIEQTDLGDDAQDQDAEHLAECMLLWKDSYPSNAYLPPYAIGRITTRLYAALSNIKKDTVGKMMSIAVANFFNACLIEEARIEHDNVNSNNDRSKISVLTANLAKVETEDKLQFTKWIMSCPMLNSFVDENIYNQMRKIVGWDCDYIDVLQILSKIDSKSIEDESDKKLSFSGEKSKGLYDTIKVFLNHGYTLADIEQNIIHETNDNAEKYIVKTQLFDVVYMSSISSFRFNYVAKKLDGEILLRKVNSGNKPEAPKA